MSNEFPTGIEGFDKLINGGFNAGQKITVFGTPGTGKTIFCSHFIYNGIVKYNQPGVYISTQEKRESFFRNMLNFGMDFEKLEKAGKFKFIEQGFVKKEFHDILRILDAIHKINASRVVFDSVNFFDVKYPETGDRNMQTLSYMRGLSSGGRVSLWVSENYHQTEIKYRADHFLSDGLIHLQHLTTYKGPYTRTINVVKLRGINHDDKRYPLLIGTRGITIKKI